jgi:hypothetical protein
MKFEITVEVQPFLHIFSSLIFANNELYKTGVILSHNQFIIESDIVFSVQVKFCEETVFRFHCHVHFFIQRIEYH